MDVGAHRPQVVIRLLQAQTVLRPDPLALSGTLQLFGPGLEGPGIHLRAEVSWTQDGMYLARDPQSLELRWQIRCAMGNVHVPDAQNEYHLPGASVVTSG